MLVLTRKPGQTILINGGRARGGITIEINEVRGQQVRVGISASDEFVIDREEVDDAKQEDR